MEKICQEIYQVLIIQVETTNNFAVKRQKRYGFQKDSQYIDHTNQLIGRANNYV